MELYRVNEIPCDELDECFEPKIEIYERMKDAKSFLNGIHLIHKDCGDYKAFSMCKIDLQEIIFKCIIETKREISII
jgi:hypothetical protein